MDQPIASYKEACFPRKQSINLYGDRVHVTGSVFLSQDYEVTIPLSQLSGMTNRSHVRSQFFQAGIFLAIITGIITITLYNIPTSEPLTLLTKILFSLPFVGILLSLTAIKKIEVVHFTANEGFVLLSIRCAGPDKEHFAEFTKRLTQVIQDLKSIQPVRPTDRQS
jgi:hypothetical protein